MKIVIGADIVPTRSNEIAFINADVRLLLDDDLIALLNDADYRVFNLEVPLTDSEDVYKRQDIRRMYIKSWQVRIYMQ